MITKPQRDAIQKWILAIAEYPPTAEIVVDVTGAEGGSAAVKITPDGVVRTMSGVLVEV